MTRRVLLGAGRFAVSKPGYDVTTAPPIGLQFSSDWGQLGLFTEGAIDANWNSTSWHYFGFGKAFSRPPIVNMQLDGPNRRGGFDGYLAAEFENNRTRQDGSTQYNNHYMYAIVGNDSIRVKSMRQNDSGGSVPVPDYRIRYWVFDHNF